MKKLDYLKIKTIVKPLFLGENAARYYPGENAATFNWRKCRQRHFVPPAFSPDTLKSNLTRSSAYFSNAKSS